MTKRLAGRRTTRAGAILAATWAMWAIASGCRRAEVVPPDLVIDDGRQWIDATRSADAPVIVRAAAAAARNQDSTLTIDFAKMTLQLR